MEYIPDVGCQILVCKFLTHMAMVEIVFSRQSITPMNKGLLNVGSMMHVFVI